MSVLCVGQLVADIVVRPVKDLPYPGRTNMVDEVELLSGGCAANAAAVLAKLGAEVKLVAVIGRDALGDAALADLKAVGVGVETVRRDAEFPTSTAIVLVDDEGQRSFFYRKGGNERLTNAHISDADLKAARFVHVGGAMKLLHLDIAALMRKARSFGCRTSLDTDWDVYGNWMKTLAGAIPSIDYFMTNEEEAAQLTGRKDPREGALDLLARGPQAVLIKRGANGALAATSAGLTDFPTYRVEVRDTTCAGDSFAAGFLFGISRDYSIDEAVRLGNAAGALCTTQISHRAVKSLGDTLLLTKGEMI